jgi:hypothetical protein
LTSAVDEWCAASAVCGHSVLPHTVCKLRCCSLTFLVYVCCGKARQGEKCVFGRREECQNFNDRAFKLGWLPTRSRRWCHTSIASHCFSLAAQLNCLSALLPINAHSRTSSTLTLAQLLHCIASRRNGPRSTTETPRMDKMAAEGIRFTDFHAGYSVCTASRAALLVSSSRTISTNIHPHIFTQHPHTRAFSLIHPRLLPTDSALTREPIHSSSHSLHIL